MNYRSRTNQVGSDATDLIDGSKKGNSTVNTRGMTVALPDQENYAGSASRTGTFLYGSSGWDFRPRLYGVKANDNYYKPVLPTDAHVFLTSIRDPANPLRNAL